MSSNDGGHVVEIYASGTISDEMNALDQLGPLTRQAIYDSPIRYSAGAVLKQIRDYEEQQRKLVPEMFRSRFCIDPRHQDIDRAVADGLVKNSVEIVLRDRSEVDAMLGVKPLRSNVGVKSIREQRRSLRKVRW